MSFIVCAVGRLKVSSLKLSLGKLQAPTNSYPDCIQWMQHTEVENKGEKLFAYILNMRIGRVRKGSQMQLAQKLWEAIRWLCTDYRCRPWQKWSSKPVQALIPLINKKLCEKDDIFSTHFENSQSHCGEKNLAFLWITVKFKQHNFSALKTAVSSLSGMKYAGFMHILWPTVL